MENKEITRQIIGCAMRVHSFLGCGFQEKIYQRALALEFSLLEIDFQRKKQMELRYRGEVIGQRRVDFFVADEIMVKIKTMSILNNAHLAQAINYCEAYALPFGLSLNFGAPSLEFKRVFNVNHPNNRNNRITPKNHRK